jgi:hypothetical protein
MELLHSLSRLIRAHGMAFLRVVLESLGSLLGLLAELAPVSNSDSDGEVGPVTTGVHNYRTQKHDDGTDPYGWYTLD